MKMPWGRGVHRVFLRELGDLPVWREERRDWWGSGVRGASAALCRSLEDRLVPSETGATVESEQEIGKTYLGFN